MPFDRAWAKSHGYSDQEVDAYLASPQGRADSMRAGAAPDSTATSTPGGAGPDTGLIHGALSLAPPALATLGQFMGGPPLGAVFGSGGEAGVQLAEHMIPGMEQYAPQTSGDAAERIGKAAALYGAGGYAADFAAPLLAKGGGLARIVAGRIPVLRDVMDAIEALGTRRAGGAVEQAATGAAEAPAAESVPEGKTLVREHLRTRPTPKVRGSAKGRIAVAKSEAKALRGAPGPKSSGTAASRVRVAKVEAGRGVTKFERPPGTPRGVMRGASGPELERRAVAQATEKARAAQSAAQESGDLSQLLEASHQAESVMEQAGLSDIEKAYVRQQLRASVSPQRLAGH